MGRPDQRNNSTIINEDTREPPTNALKCATNSQIKANSNWYNRDKKKKSQNIKQIISKYKKSQNNYLSLQIYFSWSNQKNWNITCIEPLAQKSVWSNGQRIHSCNLKITLSWVCENHNDFPSHSFSRNDLSLFPLSNEFLSLYLTL